MYLSLQRRCTHRPSRWPAKAQMENPPQMHFAAKCVFVSAGAKGAGNGGVRIALPIRLVQVTPPPNIRNTITPLFKKNKLTGHRNELLEHASNAGSSVGNVPPQRAVSVKVAKADTASHSNSPPLHYPICNISLIMKIATKARTTSNVNGATLRLLDGALPPPPQTPS